MTAKDIDVHDTITIERLKGEFVVVEIHYDINGELTIKCISKELHDSRRIPNE